MRKYYLWTIGCQMNDADAARLRQGLEGLGFAPSREPREAELAILVTCVVRQSAEDKVIGRLTSLKGFKRHRQTSALLVMGCFVDGNAQLQERYPYVDAFFRPSDVQGLLSWVQSNVEWQLPVAGEPAEPHTETQLISALVPVSYGCDHHCTYCIVRLRRGKQDSRPVHEILRDAQSWLQRRAREIVLLGQNVDAYGQDRAPGHADLADLLRSVHRLDGLARLRFLTSHPAHMSQKLIDTVTALPKACPHLELPVQSGDDDILHRMRRGYTVADYVALLERIRAGVPSCSIATDVIVGFPGESAAQFQRTYDLIAHGRFDAVHIAKFSPRAGTPAARLVDSVSSEEKESRRRSLEQLQEGIAASINAELLGQQVEVLVEGQSRGKWMGRTATNKLVFFAHRDAWRGELARVEITWTGPWSLQGRLVDRPCEGTQPQSEPPEGVSVVPSAGR